MPTIEQHLARRFGETPAMPSSGVPEVWKTLAARGSVRAFDTLPVDDALLQQLCALALCAPTKSDLQQRDIILVSDSEQKSRICALIADQSWTENIPSLLIFCGNNRRQRQIQDLRSHPFANDHLDAFFNAALDAGIALSAFVVAAEAIGLGCCPISAVRNQPQALSDILALPGHVFPVAGLAVGWPANAPEISPRLPLRATVHRDRFDDTGITDTIAAYDRRRQAVQPYKAQRYEDRFGKCENYGWSEDKARQYAKPERAEFGHYIRSQGFKLD